MGGFSADGKRTRIADSVGKLVRIDKNSILYLSEGDLYYYDGKKSTMVQYDVNNFWCLVEEETINKYSTGLDDYNAVWRPL